jgi:hypothetical protein
MALLTKKKEKRKPKISSSNSSSSSSFNSFLEDGRLFADVAGASAAAGGVSVHLVRVTFDPRRGCRHVGDPSATGGVPRVESKNSKMRILFN